jgi:hypothetical protein
MESKEATHLRPSTLFPRVEKNRGHLTIGALISNFWYRIIKRSILIILIFCMSSLIFKIKPGKRQSGAVRRTAMAGAGPDVAIQTPHFDVLYQKRSVAALESHY